MVKRVLLVNKFYYPRGGDCVVVLNTEAMLRENGFPAPEEPYRPHITLGRGMKLSSPPPAVIKIRSSGR